MWCLILVRHKLTVTEPEWCSRLCETRREFVMERVRTGRTYACLYLRYKNDLCNYLNVLCRKKLNIKDVPMMMGAVPVAAPAAAGDEEGDSEPQMTKSSFTIKLASFDTAKKIALIKEVKNLMEGMNLVQAKQFIESAPQVLKADIAKDEAENIKKSLEAVGGVCEIS
ncbi:hypothetical protein AVEN_128950-1 [Araneus ventricosus]|uniref:Large ribosomal subunit protein bL12 C-terminal domain-containing protein n=1 Tax=Araneus ventricosus TaxID=182803 RepID=A0A4Y2QDZ6_ARAVE|nr:hypothetical protein AVEN_128950-1 [Araneus ventricosus]